MRPLEARFADSDEERRGTEGSHSYGADFALSSGGRLILGFYDADAVAIATKIARLAEVFASPSGRKDNLARGEVVLWWDKRPNSSALSTNAQAPQR